MANRYWVGGTANWDGTAGTKWSDVSGGAGGFSVPTSADDVFFDSASGAAVVTIATGNTGAKSITCNTFTGTLTGTANITVSGNITLVAGMTYSHTGNLTINATSTLITAGKAFSALIISGTGITVTLGDALDLSTRQLTLTEGTFTTSNFNVTAGTLSSSNTNSRTLNLGSSTVTLSSSLTIISTSFTLNAGTSSIVMTSATASFNGGGLTFYNVSFTNTAATSRSLASANTFNNLSFTGRTSSGVVAVTLQANQTVNGTLTFSAGTDATCRHICRSITIGTQYTLTCNAVAALSDVDFADIAFAGASISGGNITGTRLGDGKGNSNITFGAGKTVYYRNTNASSNWYDAASWSATSGGAADATQFPLAQDTAIFPAATYPPSGGTVTIGFPGFLSAIDMSLRTTNTMTLTLSAAVTIFGDLTYGTGVTPSTGQSITFAGRKTQNLTNAGTTSPHAFIVDSIGGTLKLLDALNTTNTITLTNGTFDANTFNVTCSFFASNNSNVRTLTMGSGTWTLSGANIVTPVWDLTTTTNLTFNKGTANIVLSNTTTTARNFVGGNKSYNKLTIGGTTGTQQTYLTGSNSFTELASTKTVAHTITFQTASLGVQLGAFTVSGTLGNVVTVNASGRITLIKPSPWYMGANSTINANASGFLATAGGGIDYLSVASLNGVNSASGIGFFF